MTTIRPFHVFDLLKFNNVNLDPMTETNFSMTMDVIYVMGVSGCGKTTVGQAVARELNWKFADGDDFHPKENREKMASGIPLTDIDRIPWLEVIRKHVQENKGIVFPCSSLKRAYRDVLRNGVTAMFVFLKVEKSVLEERMRIRKGHYMPPSLLQSQLETLEDPSGEADVLVVDNQKIHDIEKIVEVVKKEMQLRNS